MAKRFFAAVTVSLWMVFWVPLSCLADPVRVGIGFAIPPYVIRDKDAGVEVDTIREAFRNAGFETEFVYLPNLRLPIAFADGSVDCVASNAAYDLARDAGVPAYSSDVTVVFQNYAVTLKKRGVVINSVADLTDKQVLGFNNASKYLGREFAAMAASNKRYSELADQALQVRMLCSGRVDAVISDKRIFLYWWKQLTRSPDACAVTVDQDFVFHPVFPPAPRRVAFRDDALRIRFNKGLDLLRQAGGIEIIEKRYSGADIQ